MNDLELTEDQIKEIIYDARVDRDKTLHEFIQEFIGWPKIDGSTQRLKEKFPNHYIQIFK